MEDTPLYAKLSRLVQAYLNCKSSYGSPEWADKHRNRINELSCKYLPRGSGFDSGSMLDIAASKPNKLVIQTSFHHMNDVGMYDGWTEHTVTVKPDLASGFTLTISGKNPSQIKDCIHDVFYDCLQQIAED